MGEVITLQRLLEMQRKVWYFKINADHETAELVAREQLKSFGQISRIGLLITLPLAIYALAVLFVFADPVFLAIACFFLAVSGFMGVRNYRRQVALDPDTADCQAVIKGIHIDSIITSIAFSCILAIPFAFGQIPYSLDIAILAMGGLVVGGFVFGSIPRAQIYNLLITTIFYAISFIAAKGYAGISAAALLAFFALCSNFIYRLFFFNFVQRHLHAAKQKDASETVRLLLYDYAEQSSDWLWEVNADHLIVNPSARFDDQMIGS